MVGSGQGHAIVATGVREHDDGSFSIDVWDNNHPFEKHAVEVKADGSYTYEPLHWSGSPSAEGSGYGRVAAMPLFAPRGLHLLSDPNGDSAIADLPAGVAPTSSSSGTMPIPVEAAGGAGAAGSFLRFAHGSGTFTVNHAQASATIRGGGLQLDVKRTSGSGGFAVTFDVASGTVSVQGGTAALSIERDGDLYKATGAKTLTVKPNGDVETTPDGTAPVIVTGPSGVVQTYDPSGGNNNGGGNNNNNNGGGSSNGGNGGGIGNGGGTGNGGNSSTGNGNGNGGSVTGAGNGGGTTGGPLTTALGPVSIAKKVSSAQLAKGVPVTVRGVAKGARVQVRLRAAGKNGKPGKVLRTIVVKATGKASQRIVLKLGRQAARKLGGTSVVVEVTATAPGATPAVRTVAVRIKR
jgi:hypothetical protein